MFTLNVDMHRVIEQVSILTLVSGQLPGAVQAAANETAKDAEHIAESHISRVVNAPDREIEPRVRSSSAARINKQTFRAQVYVISHRIDLKRMGARQAARGVVYTPYRGRQKLVHHAFGPKIPRLGRHVFVRKSRARLPLKKVPGLNLRTDPVVAKAMASASRQAEKALARNVEKHVLRMLDAVTSGRTLYGQVAVVRALPRGGTLAFGSKTSFGGARGTRIGRR